jgi:glycosyltransferase involved in cell wall biosynthesis
MKPLVSLICLCFNHRLYLRQAIESVVKQTYDNIQIILIDDASTDGSQEELKKIADENPTAELILLPQNIGNCKAFNVALQKVKGDFVIDFATDDVMLPHHIEKLVTHFQQLDESYGVVFTDATYIDEKDNALRYHFDYLLKKKLIQSIPQGDIFHMVLTTYFIPGPTMMVRKKIFEDLGGYDEALAYEDFDFWIRSARNYKYSFLNENQMFIRRSKTSMSAGLYKQGDNQLHSTYLICKKAKALCRDSEDENALRHRVLYEFRHAVLSENKTEAKLLADFLEELNSTGFQFYFLKLANALPLPWHVFRKLYHRIRFK